MVDDRWENRLVLTNLLEPLGFQVRQAEHGAQGLLQAREWRPDLVITDLVMPEMDGFELTQAIRDTPELATTPVIASSASVFNFDRQKSREVGCDDFLPKPVQAEELFACLRDRLHLTWIYEIGEASPADLATGELVLPPAAELTAIQAALTIGDFDVVEVEARRLQQLDRQYAVFAARVLLAAADFDERAICELLAQVGSSAST